MDNPKVAAAMKGLKLFMAVVTIVTAGVEIKETLKPSTPKSNPDPAPQA